MKTERKLIDGRRVWRFLSDGSQGDNEAIVALVEHLNRLDPGSAQSGALVNDGWQYKQEYVDIPRGPFGG